MNIAAKYQKSLDQWCMRFKTPHPVGDNYDGVVTHVKPKFIVLREEESFEFDGIIILPKRFIKGVRDAKCERCCNQILRQRGAIKRLHVPRWLDSCETIREVIAAMRQREVWPGVEVLFNKTTESAFYLGPITRADDEGFSIKCYDAAGRWEKNYELTYGEVFRIEFDSRYCRHFNTYMRAKEDAFSA